MDDEITEWTGPDRGTHRAWGVLVLLLSVLLSVTLCVLALRSCS